MEKPYERFLGFANIYDEGRPHLPKKAIELLKIYLKNDLDLIIDIGCGTGNSTEVCVNFAKKVIGVEASKDMLARAKEKENNKLIFKHGYGENTGVDSNIADLVICSQAFHWMDAKKTIAEVSRILKKGGIFAVIYADFFPVIDIRLEKLLLDFHKASVDNEKDMIFNPMSQHLNNMIESNKFEYCREICFSNETQYDKEKFKKLILSKSSIQKAIKNNYEPITSKLENLDEFLDEVFQGKTLKATFSYKMKIGIK